MKASMLKKLDLPTKPGVYFFKKGGNILYIGKATSLRDRVKSYFSKDLIATRGPLIVDMVFKATTVSCQETDSVLEALILEAALIKKHQPHYNTKEKDDKSFLYVAITKEKLPKLLLVRGKDLELKILNSKTEILNKSKISKKEQRKYQTVYGPFTNGNQLREAMKIVRRIFPYIDTQSAKKDNYEFYKQIGLTPEITTPQPPPFKGGVAASRGGADLYRKNIRNLNLFFQGKKKQIIVSLKKDMKQAAAQKEFERAAAIRNQIFALQHINDVSLLTNEAKNYNLSTKTYRVEAYDIAHMSGKNMVGVMTVISNGEKANQEYRKFIIRTQTNSNDTGALEEILSRRFRHTEWGMPDLVVTDGGEAQKRVAERILARYQLDIPVVSVVKDDHHKAREILGDDTFTKTHKQAILLANFEAHRFAITFHKKKRSKSFLPS